MKSLSLALSVFIFFCLFVINPVWTQKSQPAYEDYEIFDPNDPVADAIQANPKAANENANGEASPNNNIYGDKSIDDVEQDTNQVKTKFTDERFAKLFPSRNGKLGGRYDERRLMPKEVSKPKPTLPSFIRSTPPLIKVQITTPTSINVFNNRQRTVATTSSRKISTTTTTPKPNNRNRSLNNLRQQNGRLSTPSLTRNPQQQQQTLQQLTTPTPGSKRRLNSSSSRFLRINNSTIPALNPRGRN